MSLEEILKEIKHHQKVTGGQNQSKLPHFNLYKSRNRKPELKYQHKQMNIKHTRLFSVRDEEIKTAKHKRTDQNAIA